MALKRDDFSRTKHPIYSFAVWGKGKEDLLKLNNKSSFGIDSPFSYFKDNNFKNLFIDKDCQHSYTFVHYVEEQEGPVPYRYLKDFTANYIDEAGNEYSATYSMNVRDLDMDVFILIYPYEAEWEADGILKRFYINDIEYKLIDIAATYPSIAEDVRNNKSRKLCSYIGQ